MIWGGCGDIVNVRGFRGIGVQKEFNGQAVRGEVVSGPMFDNCFLMGGTAA